MDEKRTELKQFIAFLENHITEEAFEAMTFHLVKWAARVYTTFVSIGGAAGKSPRKEQTR